MRSGAFVGAAALDIHEPVLIRGGNPAPARPVHGAVAGWPFELSEVGARVIVGGDARVLWLSPAAHDLIETSKTIAVADGRIAGRTRHSDQLVRSAVAEAQQRTGVVDQLIALAAGEAPELFVQARDKSRGGNQWIALTIRALGRDMDQLPDLTRLFGLTPAEQKIVRMLLQGQSVRAIAATLGTSVLTARTHLKRTYAKVNVGTKEQLFSTMLQMMVD